VSCRRTAITVLTLALLLTVSRGAAGANDLVVLDHDHRAEAMSIVSVRVRIHHAGPRDAPACRSLEPTGDDCLTLAFRWDEPPRASRLSRVDTVDVLRDGALLRAGATLERRVPIPTPRRSRRATLHLSLVTRSAAGLDWSDAALEVEVGPPPAAIRRRIQVTRGLLGLYVVTTVGLAWIAWRRARSAPR
jgi:hypothetical protein